MTAIRIELPDQVHRRAEELARRRGTTLDAFMVTALIEKLSTMFPNADWEERAKKGSWDGFDEFLAGVPDVPPESPDTPPHSPPR